MPKLIPIAPNTFIDPLKVSAIEQVQGQLFVYIDGRAFLAEGDPVSVLEEIQSHVKTEQFWAGR